MLGTLAALTLLTVSVLTVSKGCYMEGRIDKIDVRRDPKELIALFYCIELRFFMMKLLYNNHQRVRAGIN